MPAIGDQHKTNGAAANPFEDLPRRISEYTAQEIATLQSRLDKQLGPEYISSRPGASGQKVHYLAAEKVINLANEVFGFNGWSSAIQNIQIDFVDENTQTGKISLGLSVIVRVTLKDGTFHEDIGYGHIENCKGKAVAFEKAKKEGSTDGLKRALRTFGNVLGNCIYDKEFVAKVTKMKVAPLRWEADNLHRHSDYAPVKKEEDEVNGLKTGDHTPHTDTEEDFGIADFDDADFGESHAGHPDEVVLAADTGLYPRPRPETNNPMRHQQHDSSNSTSTATSGLTTPARPVHMRQAHVPPIVANAVATNPSFTPGTARGMQPPNQGIRQPDGQHGSRTSYQPSSSDVIQLSSPGVPSQHFHKNPQHQPPPQISDPGNLPAAFVSARAAATINSDQHAINTSNIPKFDPHAESPSIRKTVGVDHARSVPVKRGLVPSPIPAPPAREGFLASSFPTKDFVNPTADNSRRIGAPGAGVHSPMNRSGMNGSAYRPPARRGPDPGGISGGTNAPAQNAAIRRPPLGDVSNLAPANSARLPDGGDPKRQRVSGPENEIPGLDPGGPK